MTGAARSSSGFVALARRVDSVTPWTEGHSARVAAVAAEVVRAAGWPSAEVARLACVAELHDVGKICVGEEVLACPGTLPPEARAELALHPVLGAGMLATVLATDEVAWVRHHHERWDGGGYPDGLRADEIPAGASILALAESWDAMTRGCSGAPLSPLEALAECRRVSGAQFAPWAVEALLVTSVVLSGRVDGQTLRF